LEKEDMYTYYGAAPVCAWVIPREMDRELTRNYSYNKKSEVFLSSQKRFPYNENDEGTKIQAMLAAIAWGKAIHQAKLKDDVKKAFNNFDANQSGNIDKSEL
jgi:Ca2+-binding EF-hand superfamily protein